MTTRSRHRGRGARRRACIETKQRGDLGALLHDVGKIESGSAPYAARATLCGMVRRDQRGLMRHCFTRPRMYCYIPIVASPRDWRVSADGGVDARHHNARSMDSRRTRRSRLKDCTTTESQGEQADFVRRARASRRETVLLRPFARISPHPVAKTRRNGWIAREPTTRRSRRLGGPYCESSPQCFDRRPVHARGRQQVARRAEGRTPCSCARLIFSSRPMSSSTRSSGRESSYFDILRVDSVGPSPRTGQPITTRTVNVGHSGVKRSRCHAQPSAALVVADRTLRCRRGDVGGCAGR